MPRTASFRPKKTKRESGLATVLWRVERLERQVQQLSELVRDHAEDADRLVRIVAEDRDVLRRELLQQHQALRKRRRRAGAKL
jgi:hypothetical protein